MLAKLRNEVARLPVGLWIVDSGIAPVDLYVYLHARFGPPNGFGMTLKTKTSDNLMHWHWSLQYQDRVIEFMGMNMWAQIAAEGTGDPDARDISVLVDALKADFANHAAAMSAERKRLERWSIFINPHCRLRRVVEEFIERLKKLDLPNVELPGTPRSESEIQTFKQRFEHAVHAYSEALGLCTSLRMLAPVLAESFVNLVIFVLVDHSIRDDQRLYDSLFRQDIDVRVRGLHLSCGGFVKAIDVRDDRFKAFQTLMQHRNDFLHGNIVPDKLAYEEVYFDGMTPLPKKYQNMAELALVNSMRHVEPENALADITTVENFVSLVLEAMHEKAAAMVEHFMLTLDPGWREDKQRPGILFPGHFAFAMPGGKNSTPEDVVAPPGDD